MNLIGIVDFKSAGEPYILDVGHGQHNFRPEVIVNIPSKVVALVMSMIVFPVSSYTTFCSREKGADGSKMIPSFDSHFYTRLLCSSDPYSDRRRSVGLISLVRNLDRLWKCFK